MTNVAVLGFADGKKGASDASATSTDFPAAFVRRTTSTFIRENEAWAPSTCNETFWRCGQRTD